MREAFGGVFMIRISLVFVFIFVAFSAISLNYAKAFRVKNHVIDFIEQQEVFSLDTLFHSAKSDKLAKLDAILDAANYNKECQNVDVNGKIKTEPGAPSAYCYRGVVFAESTKIDRTIIYNVSTFADWNLGTLSMLLRLGNQSQNSQNVIDGSWEISGEARVVKR